MTMSNSSGFSLNSISNDQTEHTPNQANTGISASEVHQTDEIDDIELKGQIAADDAITSTCRDYEIGPQLLKLLRTLIGTPIIILCDTSGSMRTHIGKSQETRWDKLVRFVQGLFEFCSKFNPDGIGIRFTNGEKFQVKDSETLNAKLKIRPGGYKRLVPTLKEIFELETVANKKLLVFVATDGKLTNKKGNSDIHRLESLMRETRRENTYVSFLMCTDNHTYVEYLNKWYETMERIDVTHEFHLERRKFRQRSKRKDCDFTHGDYYVKVVLGPIYPNIYYFIQND